MNIFEEYALYKYSHRFKMKSNEFSMIQDYMDIDSISKWEGYIKEKYPYEPGTEKFKELSSYLKSKSLLRGVQKDSYSIYISVVLGVFLGYFVNGLVNTQLFSNSGENQSNPNIEMVLLYSIAVFIITIIFAVGFVYLIVTVINQMSEYELKKLFYEDFLTVVVNNSQINGCVNNPTINSDTIIENNNKVNMNYS